MITAKYNIPQDILEPQSDIAKQIQKRANFVNPDIKRIVDIPLKDDCDDSLIEAFSKHYLTPEVYSSGIRLRPTQADGLLQFAAADGLFAPIGAGGGKTLLSLLLAHIAHTEMGKKRIMLIVPSALVSKLMNSELAFYRHWVKFSFAVHCLAGRTAPKRRSLARSKRPGLYVYSYSLLSRDDADELLELIQPQMIILDEAHSVAGVSARTTRLARYVKAHHPIYCPMSGTMSSKRISDYSELARAALKKYNFLPESRMLAGDWGNVLDANSAFMDNVPLNQMAGLEHIYKWAIKNAPSKTITHPSSSAAGLRQAYCYRMAYTPGVVVSNEIDCNASLLCHNIEVPMPADNKDINRLIGLMTDVDDAGLAPNGDEIAFAIHKYKWLNELTAGFYNELYWPSAERVARLGNISEKAAGVLIERSIIHHEAHQEYTRELRAWIADNARTGLDTPKQIGLSMFHHQQEEVGHHLYSFWNDMKDLDFPERVERLSRAIRISSFKIKAAVAFAQAHLKERKKHKGHKGMIFWYNHQEIGRWLIEGMLDAGVDAVLCDAGEKSAAYLLDGDVCKDKIILATYHSHGTGRNLQYFDTQYFVEWPRPAKTAEQAIARLHRLGQDSDSVTVITSHSNMFDYMNYAATLSDALYVHQCNGTPQRLILAAYDPRPKIFPHHVLRERGFAPVYKPTPALMARLANMGEYVK